MAKSSGQFKEIATKVAKLIETHATADPSSTFYGKLSTWVQTKMGDKKASLNEIMRAAYPHLMPAKPTSEEGKPAYNAALNSLWAKICQASGGTLEMRNTMVAHTKYAKAAKAKAAPLTAADAAKLLG